jgi:hypothetical protein
VLQRLRLETVPSRAAVCIGVRRCRKSTYLFQIIRRLLASGTPRENILYLNFFDDRLHDLRQAEIGQVAEASYSIYPEKQGAETSYCFFDEIQAVPGGEPFMDGLIRPSSCTVRCRARRTGPAHGQLLDSSGRGRYSLAGGSAPVRGGRGWPEDTFK